MQIGGWDAFRCFLVKFAFYWVITNLCEDISSRVFLARSTAFYNVLEILKDIQSWRLLSTMIIPPDYSEY